MNNDKVPQVLSCIDGSRFSEAVCDYAAWIAKTVDAPVHLLHTIERDGASFGTDLSGAIGLGSSQELLHELTELEQNRNRLLMKKGKLMLNAAKQKVQAAGVTAIHTTQQHGSLPEALVEMEEYIRVLVIGIRGEAHENDSAGVGAQLETVIRSLHKPILVVNKTFTTPRRIMLAYDGSTAARKALDMVAASPLFKAVPCHLVHVVSADEQHDPLLEKAARQLTDNGIEVITAALKGRIEDVLTRYQADNDIDLTLMGAFSHTRVRDFLLGSFTVKMLANTQRPLLLLR